MSLRAAKPDTSWIYLPPAVAESWTFKQYASKSLPLVLKGVYVGGSTYLRVLLAGAVLSLSCMSRGVELFLLTKGLKLPQIQHGFDHQFQ